MTSSKSSELLDLFYFVSDNTSVEWALHKTKDGDFTLGTLHDTSLAGNWKEFGIESRPETSIHSHPNTPPELIEESLGINNKRNITKDSDMYNIREKRESMAIHYYVYFPKTHTIVQLEKNRIKNVDKKNIK